MTDAAERLNILITQQVSSGRVAEGMLRLLAEALAQAREQERERIRDRINNEAYEEWDNDIGTRTIRRLLPSRIDAILDAPQEASHD